MKKNSIVLVSLIIFLFTSAAFSQARRHVKPIATGTGNGSSWSNASSDLQGMMDASAPNDEVWVAKGTYKPVKNTGFTASHIPLSDPRYKSFVLPNGIKLYGGFAGTEIAITQRNYAINKTILSGDFLGNDAGLTNNNENAYHVVFTSNNNFPVLLDGFTITGGNTTGIQQAFYNNAPWYTALTADGGALFLYFGGHTVQNCIFINNIAAGKGGAIRDFGGGAYLNCLYINNHATTGAVSFADNIGSNLESHFTNCTMFNNSSGGAVCLTNITDNTYITNCIIWGNAVTGLSAAGYAVLSSDIQNAFLPGNHSGVGTIQANPVFSNAADPDGIDNILGTADDGLIPLCGPTIGTGINSGTSASKDLKNQVRIQNGTIDMGAYETALVNQITTITISELSNHATTENLPGRGYCIGKPALFKASTEGSGGVFQWKQNGNNVGSNSSTLSINNFHNGDLITLSYTNQAGCGPATVIQSNTITLANVSSGKPVISSVISGPTNACPYISGPTNGTPVAYKINKVPGAAVYHWYMGGINTAGATIVSHPNGGGVNDTIVMVEFNSSFDGSTGTRILYVSAENWCGTSVAKSLAIAVNMPQATGAFISSVSDACPYMQSAANPTGTPVTFAIRKVSGAASYIWIVPLGVTILSHSGTGENDTAIVVRFLNSFVSGNIGVQAVNFCGAKPPRIVSITKKIPGMPGAITGPGESCPYVPSATNPAGIPVNYTIRKVMYATTYTWSLPAGASATHPGGTGINDTIIRVSYSGTFTGGAITVRANSNCSISAIRSLTITKKAPAMPYYIIGLTDVCPVMQSPNNPPGTPTNYTIKKVAAATSYSWTVPTGTTITHPAGAGVNDTIIRVTFLGNFTGGTITVVSNGNCGNSAERRLDILRRLPAAPGAITASAPTACPQRRITYSLTAIPSYATSVQWIVPASGTIISGQGSTSLVVEFPGATLPTDSIRAMGVNACATSSQRKLKVGILPACRSAEKGDNENIVQVITKNKIQVLNTNNELEVTVMPNPSWHEFKLLLSGKDYNTPVSIEVVNTLGRSIERRTNIQNNQTITLGNNWSQGIYFVTLIQGSRKKILRLVKL